MAGTSPEQLDLAAHGLEPTADVDLRVRLPAVVARLRFVCGFLGPFKDRELRVTAVDHNPADRFFALLTADFTSIYRVDHYYLRECLLRTWCDYFTAEPRYSSICRSSGGSSRHSIFPISLSARFSADDLHGSTVTTNGNASAG